MNQADCLIKVGNTFLAQEYISSVTVKVSIKKVENFLSKDILENPWIAPELYFFLKKKKKKTGPTLKKAVKKIQIQVFDKGGPRIDPFETLNRIQILVECNLFYEPELSQHAHIVLKNKFIQANLNY